MSLIEELKQDPELLNAGKLCVENRRALHKKIQNGNKPRFNNNNTKNFREDVFGDFIGLVGSGGSSWGASEGRGTGGIYVSMSRTRILIDPGFKVASAYDYGFRLDLLDGILISHLHQQ